MSKYKHKLPKDDLKRFGKEVAKKLVSSDYKSGRVKDPTSIEEKHQKKIKAYCKEYLDKALAKHKKHEDERVARKAKRQGAMSLSASATPLQSPMIMADDTPVKDENSDPEDVKLSDHDMSFASPNSPSQSNGALKRKRGSPNDLEGVKHEDDSFPASPAKKLNAQYDSDTASPPPPPPPPAPPVDTPHDANTPDTNTSMDIHADTNFKSRSMADVLAQAQQEGEDEEMDDDPPTKTEGIKSEDWASDDVKMGNPLVESQPTLKRENGS